MTTQFANLQQAVDTLTATVNKEDTVIDGALVVFRSIPDLIQSAVNDALQKGAPASTLSAFGTLNDVINQKADALAAALANVPTAPPTGAGTAQVPPIVATGTTQAEYVTDLQQAGLVLGNVTFEDGAATVTADGDVIRTNPPAGALVAVGSSVDLVVAQAGQAHTE